MKLELCHVDTCLSDYWRGHHRAHIAIPVSNGMTLKEIKQALRYELQQGAVMGNERLAELLSLDYVGPENEKEADKATRAAYAAINRIKAATKGQRKFFTDIDDSFDADYPVYAYFVFMPLD